MYSLALTGYQTKILMIPV